MMFLIRFALFVTILSSQAMALESNIPESERVITEIEMDYSNAFVVPSDWERILQHRESLEKLDLRWISFGMYWGDTVVGNPDYLREVTPEMVESYFPHLKELYFDWSQVYYTDHRYGWSNHDESPLRFISKQTNLEILSLNGWIFGRVDPRGWVTLRDFRILSTLTDLRSLSLKGASFLSENSEQFQYTLLPNLESFNADQSNIKAVAWDLFAPNLKFLSLADTEINGTDIIHISQLPHLEKLNIADTKITGGSIKKLAQLPNLKELILSDRVDGMDMRKADFSGLQSLDVLDLSNCNFTIASFTSLQMLQNLKKLKLNDLKSYGKNPNITQDLVEQLKGALPNCEIELS